MNYRDRLLPTKTYNEAVQEMKEKHLMAEVEVKELYQCPKSNKCIMECHHKLPHEPDKYCNIDNECPTCVREIASDITFFPEDFEIK
jgi:hypothetical protein